MFLFIRILLAKHIFVHQCIWGRVYSEFPGRPVENSTPQMNWQVAMDRADEVESRNANFLNTSVPYPSGVPLRAAADNLNEIHFFQSTMFFIGTNFRVYLLHFGILLLTEQLNFGPGSRIRAFLTLWIISRCFPGTLIHCLAAERFGPNCLFGARTQIFLYKKIDLCASLLCSHTLQNK